MLRLTKKADYALMAVKHLAEHPDTHARSAKDIAEEYHIPIPLLAKILQQLTRTGVLVSHSGINGGYSLARSADAITAFEVIRAIEGPLFITSCMTVHGACDLTDCCTVKEPLQKLNDTIKDLLTEMRISDLCEDVAAKGHGHGEHAKHGKENLVTLTY
ncbi:MAG TPA: Rrf2 family transcriptional regulator [Acidobacteriaceae bacterium]|jgi:Rrf2 family protein|nr:Rrf2 family transcriptional regulator [Acidobacteriaceae bacterium]